MSQGSYRRSAVNSTTIKDSGPYEAVVVNNLDPRFMGGLEVEILKYTGGANTPLKSGEIITVRYLSPFYGVTPSSGLTPQDGYANSQKSYGFWAVPPDIGAKVLVMFAEGNANYGYWLGCIQDDYMNFMVPDGRASTAITTSGTPSDLKGAKLPVGEYNKLAETGEAIDPTLFNKPYNKDFTKTLEVQGLLFDEVRGTTTTSARREVPSMVFGISTPGPRDKRQGSPKSPIGADKKQASVPYSRLGGSSFVMDDGDDKLIRKTHAEDGPPIYINKLAGETGGDETIPQNELLRFRTRTGHQIVLHNSEDLIYIGNSRGTAWLEFTSDGKIDIHAQDSISIMSDADINFTAERDFNIDAGRNINMKATARYSDDVQFLDNKESGRIQLESAWDTNILVGNNYKLTVESNSDVVVGIDSNELVNQTYSLHAKQNINNTSDKSIHHKAANSIFRTASKTIHDNADLAYMLHAKTSDVTIKTNSRLHVGGFLSQDILDEYKTTVKKKITLQTKEDSMHFESVKGINLLDDTIITGDAAEIHWNSGKSVPGVRSIEAVQIALKAEDAVDAEKANQLPTITLPYMFPGAAKPVPYESIVTRAPQHEPWSHHENMNPQAYKKEQTDREDPGGLAVNDRIITPDAFTKNLGPRSSQTVFNSGGGENFDGGTGDSVISNNTVTSNNAIISYANGAKIDDTRGDPSNVTQRFFVGDGALGTIKTKSGKTAQVAEVFVTNFQGFIDDLEATGYQIKTLLGYAKRQTVSGASWSIHASGGAIDINPPNPVFNNGPNGFYSPRPSNAPITDMPKNTLELANKHGLGWGGAWQSIDDAMHFSSYKGEGGAFKFRKGFIPKGPSNNRDDGVPSVPDEKAETKGPSGIDDSNLPGPQHIDGSPNDNEEPI